MLLYKFGTWPHWSRNVLETQSLYFAESGQLNDPLDCQIDVAKEYEQALIKLEQSSGPAEIEDLKTLLNNQITFRSEFNDGVSINFRLIEWIARQMQSASVLSFSKTPADALLWAHYAGGHNGVCLEFESDSFGDQFVACDYGDVKYLDEPPFKKMLQDTVEVYRRSGSMTGFLHNLHEKARQYVSVGVMTKSVDWKYEREFRYVRSGAQHVRFDPMSLMSVIVGSRTPECHREEIRAVLQHSALYHVRLKRAAQKPGSFQVEII